MEVFSSFHDLPTLTHPCGLTLGFFDGVHLGHRSLIRYLRSLIPSPGLVIVLAFSTHPSLLFSGRTPPCLITTIEHKLKLLAEAGVDIVLSIPFTEEIAQWPYDHFLQIVHQKLRFSHFIIGEGDAFGKERKGTQEHVLALSSRLGFSATYLPKLTFNDSVISSGCIRNFIAQGDLVSAKQLLNRPHSVLIQSGTAPWIFPTHHLCLPPSGTYNVDVRCADHTLSQSKLQVSKEKHEIHLLQRPPTVFPIEIAFQG